MGADNFVKGVRVGLDYVLYVRGAFQAALDFK